MKSSPTLLLKLQIDVIKRQTDSELRWDPRYIQGNDHPVMKEKSERSQVIKQHLHKRKNMMGVKMILRTWLRFFAILVSDPTIIYWGVGFYNSRRKLGF